MHEFKEIIKRLAETYRGDPDGFIEEIKSSFKAPRDKEGNLFLEIGAILHNFSYFKLSIAVWENALESFIFWKDKTGELACYTNLGAAYRNLGQLKEAIKYHKEALEIARKIGNKSSESKCYTNLGNTYYSLGDLNEAIECHERSLKIRKDIDVGPVAPSYCVNLGVAYRNLGNLRKAIEFHRKALKIMQDIKNRSGESKCYTNLGVAYHDLGDLNESIRYHKKSLEIVIEIGDMAVELKCYTNLGVVYHDKGDFNKAVKYHKKSLEIAIKIDDRVGESKCYTNLGAAYRNLGDFKKAIQYHEKTLRIAINIGNKSEESFCYGNLGAVYHDKGDFNKAVKYHKKSLEIAKKIGNLDSERINTQNLAFIYGNQLNEPELAYDYCNKSIELSEKIIGLLIEEEYKIKFTSRISDPYQYIVPLCIELKRKNEAFGFVERGKSRAFLDLLAATEIKPSAKVTSELKSLLDKEETCLVKLRELQTRHLRQDNIVLEPGEIEKTLKKLNLIYSKIEEIDPEYVFTRRGKPMSFDKLQDTLSLQKKDTVLIEYFVAKDKIFIFIVSSRDRKLHIEKVHISQERLNLYIENYLRVVTRCQDLEDAKDSLCNLNSCLIDPISKYLTKGDLIYFVPYGLLHYLPLHALELNREPIIKQHPVAYLTSASLIRFCQNKGSDKLENCVSFGVDFEDEAEKVAELFKVKPYIRSNATKYKVVEACTNKDIIHFSCHGKFDYKDPLSSGVILYNKEVLTAREIFNLNLDTELVTLSACDTGINDRSPGDELVGLTRAFFYAGAPSVIVSLWKVSAESTQELMLEFYKLLKSGKDKAVALQKAQVKIMKDYPHPYYWAPFVLVGDWE